METIITKHTGIKILFSPYLPKDTAIFSESLRDSVEKLAIKGSDNTSPNKSMYVICPRCNGRKCQCCGWSGKLHHR